MIKVIMTLLLVMTLLPQDSVAFDYAQGKDVYDLSSEGQLTSTGSVTTTDNNIGFNSSSITASRVVNFSDDKYNEGVYAALSCISEYRAAIVAGELSVESAVDSCKKDIIKK